MPHSARSDCTIGEKRRVTSSSRIAKPAAEFSGPIPMSDANFKRLSQVIDESLGIKMAPSKKTMIQSRLLRRLRVLGLSSYEAYCQYLLDGNGLQEEFPHFLDLATTNKTSFFRESGHFTFLANEGLPRIVERRQSGTRRVCAWSAGCSTGEEPYTLAMVIAEFLEVSTSGWDFEVFGTDVSNKVLQQASHAMYEEKDIEPIPHELRRKYLLRSKDRQKGLIRIAPELRNRVKLEHLNFMAPEYRAPNKMDLIFCRNVLIYFERERQEQIVGKLCRHLCDKGLLFIGLSETLHGLNVPLRPAGRCIYEKI